MRDRTRLWTRILWLALLIGTPTLATEPAEEELPFRISGTLSDPAGEPVENAEVWIRVAGQSPKNKHLKTDWFEPVAVATDESGSFSTRVAAEGPYRLMALHEGHPPLGHGDDVLDGEPVELSFEKPHTHSGVVRDLEGDPVGGADVRACVPSAISFGAFACLEARSNEAGEFAFRRLPSGLNRFQAVAPGKALSKIRRVKLPLGKAPESPWSLVLGPGSEVSGSVTDDAGTPAPRVNVYYSTDRVRLMQARGARDTAPLLAVLSDEDGGFTLRGLPAAEPLKLFARVTGKGPAESAPLTLEPGSAVTGVALVYLRPATATVHLIDRDEQPVEELEVLWRPVGEERNRPAGLRSAGSSRWGEVEPRGGGRFEMSGVKPGRYDITLLPRGYREIVLEAVLLEPGGVTDFGTRVVRSGVTLSGSVVDDRGEPVAEAKIEGTYLNDNGAMSRSVKSGPDGRFALGGLTDAPLLMLSASADGHASTSEQGVGTDQADYEILLDRSGSVIGRATLDDGSRPVRLGAVLESSSESRGSRRDRTLEPVRGDEEGNFEIPDAAPGTYSLRLSARDVLPLRIKGVVVRPGEEVDVGTHRLEPGGELSGVVIDRRDASPIARVAISVESTGGAMFRDTRTLGTTVSDGEGRFSIGGLPDGSVEVRAQHPDYAPGRESATLKRDEPSEELTVQLGQGGLLRGTVRDDDGLPAPGRSISFSEGGAYADDSFVRTNDAGEYRVERLRPGAYRLSLFPEPGASALNLVTKNATLREGEETVVDFGGEETIAFSGRLAKGGRPVGDVTVVLVPGEGGGADMSQMRSASTDSSGRFEVELSRPGAYDVIVQDIGRGVGLEGLVGRARIVVPDEPAVFQEIELEEGAISGRVTDADDLPIEGSIVAAAPEGVAPGGLGSGSVTQVGPDGDYRLEGVGDGTHDVYAIAEGYEMETRTVTVGGSGEVGDVDFRLVRAGELKGRVVDASGNGIGGALVFASPAGEPEYAGSIPAETDSGGYFRVSAPTSGPCDLEAVARGHAPGRLSGFVPAEGDEGPGAVITLGQGGRLAIRVVDAEGHPVGGVQPVVQPDAPSQALTIAFMFTPIPPTDANGSTTVPNLPNGGYSVSLPGRPEVAAGRAVVAGSGEAQVTLELP